MSWDENGWRKQKEKRLMALKMGSPFSCKHSSKRQRRKEKGVHWQSGKLNQPPASSDGLSETGYSFSILTSFSIFNAVNVTI
jgi:hypothetical protein